MAIPSTHVQPGQRIRVTQQMPQVDKVWTNTIEGVVTRLRQAKTGSWYAHARDDRLWLDRLELRRDDGELVTLVLDQYSVIEPLDRAEGEAPSGPTSDPDGIEPLAPAA